MYTTPIETSCEMMIAMMTEMIDLVETHLPELDITELKERFNVRGRVKNQNPPSYL